MGEYRNFPIFLMGGFVPSGVQRQSHGRSGRRRGHNYFKLLQKWWQCLSQLLPLIFGMDKPFVSPRKWGRVGLTENWGMCLRPSLKLPHSFTVLWMSSYFHFFILCYFPFPTIPVREFFVDCTHTRCHVITVYTSWPASVACSLLCNNGL